jgi:hypothetical protein
MKNEIIRLMTENENMKIKLVEIQRESEERENELISEINILVASMNKNDGNEEGEEEQQDGENQEVNKQ